jgi:hypothetical protein
MEKLTEKACTYRNNSSRLRLANKNHTYIFPGYILGDLFQKKILPSTSSLPISIKPSKISHVIMHTVQTQQTIKNITKILSLAKKQQQK